jgi:hypothetical protein
MVGDQNLGAWSPPIQFIEVEAEDEFSLLGPPPVSFGGILGGLMHSQSFCLRVPISISLFHFY